MLILVRSIAFNVLFYVNTIFWLLVGIPTFLMPYWGIVEVAKAWGRVNLVLLRWTVGIKVEIRGAEKIPKGGLIVAAKHQSAWETLAYLALSPRPLCFVYKKELHWIPFFVDSVTILIQNCRHRQLMGK